MEPTKDSIIGEARQLIGEYEKQTKQRFFASLAMIVIGVVMIGVLAYAQIKADEMKVKERSIAILGTEPQSEAIKAVNRIIDTKIALLRAEMNLRSFSGVIPGALLGLGLVGLLSRKKRLRQASVLRGIVSLVNKDS